MVRTGGLFRVIVTLAPITCSLRLPTRHIDVRFLLPAWANATPVRSSEPVDLTWWRWTGRRPTWRPRSRHEPSR